jgi:hypothetical protein
MSFSKKRIQVVFAPSPRANFEGGGPHARPWWRRLVGQWVSDPQYYFLTYVNVTVGARI